IDSRRFRCGDLRRARGHAGKGLSGRPRAPHLQHAGVVDDRTGAVVDADLSVDDHRARGAPGRAVPGLRHLSALVTPRCLVVAILLLLLALVPVYASLSGNTFLVSLFTRIVILAIAATSLNFILGYGGMVSFGHAVYIGVGGYIVGILAYEGVTSAFLQWPLALIVSGLFALVVGALSLRTRGLYFIMITLAFSQMIYFVSVGLDRYGGDDGLTIYRRSDFAGLINLSNRNQFYYLCLALLVASIYLTWRIVN